MNQSHNTSGLRWQHGSDSSPDTFLRRIKPGTDTIRSEDINELRNAIENLWEHTHDYWDDNQEVTVRGSSTTTCG
jgi:hypothetical protein